MPFLFNPCRPCCVNCCQTKCDKLTFTIRGLPPIAYAYVPVAEFNSTCDPERDFIEMNLSPLLGKHTVSRLSEATIDINGMITWERYGNNQWTPDYNGVNHFFQYMWFKVPQMSAGGKYVAVGLRMPIPRARIISEGTVDEGCVPYYAPLIVGLSVDDANALVVPRPNYLFPPFGPSYTPDRHFFFIRGGPIVGFDCPIAPVPATDLIPRVTLGGSFFFEIPSDPIFIECAKSS